MKVWYSDSFTVPLCRLHSDKIFVYGDNLARNGKAGQAIIRDEPNTFGVVTKVAPNRLDSAYFKDKPSQGIQMRNDLRGLWKLWQKSDIVFPCAGLGTGLAQMDYWSPFLYDEMCDILLSHFGITNGEYKEEMLL